MATDQKIMKDGGAVKQFNILKGSGDSQVHDLVGR